MSLFFCNTGWMREYDGLDGDDLVNGGAYNDDEYGSEVCNFTVLRNKVYGFVRVNGAPNLGNLCVTHSPARFLTCKQLRADF